MAGGGAGAGGPGDGERQRDAEGGDERRDREAPAAGNHVAESVCGVHDLLL
jgi:hypothetical protein